LHSIDLAKSWYINSTGRTPQQDNSEVVCVLTQGFNGLSDRLTERLDNVADRVKALENTTKATATQRRVPGANKLAA
jgi:hypothetical protein